MALGTRYADAVQLNADPATYERLKQALGNAARPLHCLAIPPSMFGPVVQGLANAGRDHTARVVVEKPFGRDEMRGEPVELIAQRQSRSEQLKA